VRFKVKSYEGVPVTLTIAVTSRPLRSKAFLLRRFSVPAGASASMLAVSVLLSSIDSTLVIDACSNSNCRVVPPNVAEAALASRMPSTLTPA